MKKRYFIRSTGVLVLVALMVMMTACLGGTGGTSGGDAPAATPPASDAPAGGDAPAADAPLEPVTLQLTMHDPETSRVGQGMIAWAEEVNKATGGALTIKVNGSGSLAGAPDALDYVKKGSADIGWVYTMFNPGQFTLTEVVSIPMAGIDHPVQTANILWDLYDETPELQAELNNGFKMLEMYGNPANFISTTDKPIKSLDDIKGVSLRCPAGGMSEVMAAWGANPMNVPAGEAADALQKGTIQGTSWEWQGIEAFKLYEHLNYYMENMTIYEGVFVLAMNQAKFDSLPPEMQKAIEDSTGREGSVKFGQLFYDAAQESKKAVMGNPGEIVEVPEAAIADFKKIADEWAAGWADNVSKEKGIDGKAYLDRALELAAKHEVKQ